MGLQERHFCFLPFLTPLFLVVILTVHFQHALGDSVTVDQPEINSGKNESERAYQLFSLLLADDVEDNSSRHPRHVIVKDGIVQPEWVTPNPKVKDSNTSLFHHGPFADRIMFDFFFGAHDSYGIEGPTCSSLNGVANPKVIDFTIDADEHSGAFTIVYDCDKNLNKGEEKNTTISVVMPVSSGIDLHFSFRKTCGSGGHPYVEFGYYEESENEAAEVSRTPFLPTGAKMVVGPHVMSTKVYLHLLSPAESQEFFRVHVKSSTSGVSVTAQGPVFGGVLRRSRSTFIYLFYDCHQKGKHQVHISIPVHPFQELEASWTKDCGGGVADGLSIGSDPWAPYDVVKRGETEASWAHALQATSARIKEDAPKLNASVRFKDFWLTNEGIALQVAPAVITIEKQELLTVLTARSLTRGAVYRTESGGLIPSGSKFRLRLRMICKRAGRSLVVVTFPIKSFAKVDFGFVKECRAPRRYVHSGFMRTANSAMLMMSFLMVACCLVCWRIKASEAGKGGVSNRAKVPALPNVDVEKASSAHRS